MAQGIITYNGVGVSSIFPAPSVYLKMQTTSVIITQTAFHLIKIKIVFKGGETSFCH